MSKKYIYIVLLLSIPWRLTAQYEDLQTKYDFLHNFIIQKKVKSITEYYYINYKAYSSCSIDSAKISNRQEFNDKGKILCNYDGYIDTVPRRLITYNYDHDGNFKSMNTTAFNTKGKLQYSIPWNIINDSKGRKIKAVLDYGNGKQLNFSFEYKTNRTTELSWSGSDTAKISLIRWELFYDKKNMLTKKYKYYENKDLCNLIEGPTTYEYDNARQLIKEVTRLATDTTAIYDMKTYYYDAQHRLTKIVEKKKDNWNCANCKDGTINYLYTYDEKGSLQTIIKYKDGVAQPIAWWFYRMEYY